LQKLIYALSANCNNPWCILKLKVDPGPSPKKERKNKYVPDVAALKFKPTMDWTVDEARTRFLKATSSIDLDTISFSDCISGMASLPGESIDCVVADPPFGLSFTGKESMYNRDDRFVRQGYREAQGDYADFSKRWISQLPRIMKDKSVAWIISGWTNLTDILNASREAHLLQINHVIWKYPFGVFTQRKFVTSHYHVLLFAKTQKYFFNKISHYPLDVWEINRRYRPDEEKNSTKLPEELIQRCIDFTTRPGDVVLDPFMGNGTTATVAKATFRHYVGFELNESMRDVIDHNIAAVGVGQFYTPYSQRIDENVQRAKQKLSSKTGSDDNQANIESWVVDEN
jgi:site-specific DNA-methyltransferase (adenine-specific)